MGFWALYRTSHALRRRQEVDGAQIVTGNGGGPCFTDLGVVPTVLSGLSTPFWKAWPEAVGLPSTDGPAVSESQGLRESSAPGLAHVLPGFCPRSVCLTGSSL